MCRTSWAHRRPHGPFSQHRFGREPGAAWPQFVGWAGEDMGPPESFGVRRPLRFLAYKLELDEKQIEQLARILDELKTERAQASVDDRRSLSELADAVSSEVFDPTKAASGAD